LYTLFHSFKGSDANDLDELNADLWNAYKEVNKLYVEKLIEIKKENDIVWINNIYLMLAPLYLKRQDLSANIGFYLHIPFPSIDIFKVFIYRTEMLKSLLCCDVIGFHTFEYASNFFHSCEDILNLTVKGKKGGFIVIQNNGRNILIKVNHIGINHDYVAANLKSQECIDFKHKITQQMQTVTYGKKQVIACVARWHPVSGCQNLLKAYLHFLEGSPPYRNTTCLILFLSPFDNSNYVNDKLILNEEGL
jgi:trehalose 6-phosphate synthase/phosphatase